MSSTTKTTDRPREDIKILFDHELTNAPGKSIIGVHLDYPPNGFTPPHRHGGATVIAYVTAGEFTSGMNGNPPKAYKPGETFIEFPGCHHTVAENNSQTSSTQAIAIFVVDTEVLKTGGYAALTVLDEGWSMD